MRESRLLKMITEDVAIVGCGPAGAAAAIQLKRSGIDPIVFEKDRIGGLLLNAHLVENYPGFPDGIAGVELARLIEKQLVGLSIRIHREEVVKADISDSGFQVESSGGVIGAPMLIIASGTHARRLSSVGIPPGLRHRIMYEVYPIRDASGQRIVVVGAGDAAFDYALTLEKRNRVTVLNRGRTRKCLDILWQRAQASRSISYMEETRIRQVLSGQGDELLLRCTSGAGPEEIRADYVVVAIGREPEVGFLSKRLARALGAKQADGLLHLAGDVRGDRMRQTAVAVGDGMMAAMRINDKHRESCG
jgi:thioredoxin reductase (NADPH)